MNSVIRSQARDDIIRQFRWYLVEQDAPETAFRFLDAIQESIEQLLRMPNMGAPKVLRNSALAGLRSWPVKGFEDIRVYYVVQAEILTVVRILHGKRDTTGFSSKLADEDGLSKLQGRNGSFAADCREVVQKLIQRLAPFQVIQECIEGNPRAAKNGSSAEDFRISHDNVVRRRHACIVKLGASPRYLLR